MTRCQMRAQRRLRELHDAYGKHDYQVIGATNWGYDEDLVYKCSCGIYGTMGDGTTVAPVGQVTNSEWVYLAYQAMNTKERVEFKAYLKRVGWQATTKKAARLIYGSRGRSMWQARYGNYETESDWRRAKEQDL